MKPLRFFCHPPDKGGSERFLRAGGWFCGRQKTNPPLASRSAAGSRPPCQGAKGAMSPLVRGPEAR